MALPPIDFTKIAQTATDALSSYGSPAEFIEQGLTSGRAIKVVIYRDVAAVPFEGDADSQPALAIVSPTEFQLPYRMPRKFDRIRINVSGFMRTYTIESASPILAQQTLPLLLLNLRAN